MSAGVNSGRNSAEVAGSSTSATNGECGWPLPSGEDLIAFALAAGFVAGPLAEPVVSACRPDSGAIGLAPVGDCWRSS